MSFSPKTYSKVKIDWHAVLVGLNPFVGPGLSFQLAKLVDEDERFPTLILLPNELHLSRYQVSNRVGYRTNKQKRKGETKKSMKLLSSRWSRMTVKGTQKTANKAKASFLRKIRPPLNISDQCGWTTVTVNKEGDPFRCRTHAATVRDTPSTRYRLRMDDREKEKKRKREPWKDVTTQFIYSQHISIQP